MTKLASLPEERIASDDPTWIIDTTLLLPKAATVHTLPAKHGWPVLSWTLGGLILVAGLGATRFVAAAWFQEVPEGVLADVTRTEGPLAISRPASVFAAVSDVRSTSRGEREARGDGDAARVDAVSFDAVPSAADTVPAEAEATVLDAKSAPAEQGAHDELAQTLDELDEAEQEASFDGRDSPSAGIRSTLALGRQLLAKQRLDAAAAAFGRVLAARRGHPGALRGLARVALARGDLDVARKFAERCVRRGPYHASNHIVLGDVLRRLSQLDAADAAYRRASRLNPSRPVDTAARSLPANPF